MIRMIKINKKYPLIITLCIVAIISFWWTKYQIEVREKIYQKNLQECGLIIDQLSMEIMQIQKQNQQLIEYKTCLDRCNLMKRQQSSQLAARLPLPSILLSAHQALSINTCLSFRRRSVTIWQVSQKDTPRTMSYDISKTPSRLKCWSLAKPS